MPLPRARLLDIVCPLMRIGEYSHIGVAALARVHKALGDETRIRIVNLMANRGELCVCDLESILDISQSKASRHLAYLKAAGLVADRRDRSWVYYRLVNANGPARSAIREMVKALAADERATRDLQRAETAARPPACAPIEPARSKAR